MSSDVPTPPMSAEAVAQYRELLGIAHRAAQLHGEHERVRTTELIKEITAAGAEVTAAERVAAEAEEELGRWWRMKVQPLLAHMGWMLPGSYPDPDPTADPGRLRDYMAEVGPATEGFRAALRKAVWPRSL